MNTFETFGAATYVSLSTFRRSGVAVATPVWCAPHEGSLYVFSAGDAGKVKRLRNANRAQLAVCTGTGKLLGEYADATAELIDGEADNAIALSALRDKYGVQMWVADSLAKLTGRFNKRTYIRIRLDTKETNS